MALVVSSLQAQILAAFKKAQSDQGDDQNKSLQLLAQDLATAIDAYIKTATVMSTGVGNMGAPVVSTSTAIT